MMLEWERHGVDQERPDPRLGPSRYRVSATDSRSAASAIWPNQPLCQHEFRRNVNSFGENSSTRISPSNTFAWRLGWGADYMLNKAWALNTEMAYKRNDGHATVNGNLNNDWNASSFGFLFGAKMFF